jgi:hypothetical protein
MLSSSLLRTATRTSFGHSLSTRLTPSMSRVAFFSSGSHDDFAPKRKQVDGEDEAMKLIKVRRADWCFPMKPMKIASHLAFRNTSKRIPSCCIWKAIHPCPCADFRHASSESFRKRVPTSVAWMCWIIPTFERASRSSRTFNIVRMMQNILFWKFAHTHLLTVLLWNFAVTGPRYRNYTWKASSLEDAILSPACTRVEN